MFESLTAILLYAAGLGIAGGLVTTAAGFGGGLILALGLGIVLGPVPGLVLSAPALMVGHLHRSWTLRSGIDPKVAWTFSLTAVPGAILGAVALVAIPPSAIWWILLGGTLLAGLELLGLISVRQGRRLVGPGGFAIGFLASAGGVGGVLLPPVLMSAGLSGVAFVSTAAVGAVMTQVARVATYGATGLMSWDGMLISVMLAVGIVAGNALGRRILVRLEAKHQRALARSVLVVAILTAAYGAAYGAA